MKNNHYKQTEIGEIPEDWSIFSLSKIVNIIGGGTPKTTEPEYWNGDIPWISIVDFNGENRFVYETEKSITESGLKNSSTQFLKKGQVIISARGTVGALAQVGKDMTFNQSCYGLDAKELLSNDFLYYLLKHQINSIKQKTHGSVFNTITRETFNNITVALPHINEQAGVVNILSSLDDKIELNKKMNKTLEEIGKALFKRWFVDFEFPNDDGKPYKSSGGKMVDSELGEIPEGWEVKNLGSISEIKNGFAFKSEDYIDGGVFLLRTRNFAQSEYIVRDEVIYLPESFYEDYRNFQLRKFDVLLVMVGASVGSMGFVTSNVLPALQNQNMWNFRARDFSNQIFIKFLVSKIVSENIGSASGSARDFFRKDFFRTIKTAYPNDQTLSKFNKIVSPMYEVLDKNQGETEKLTQIRDSLLPRLMSGKLRVKN